MEMDLTQDLPEDMLADVLRRLPPRGLAAARCVRKSWCAIINTRRLMDLLPLSLAGIFIRFNHHEFPEFFARPSTRDAAISGKLHYLPTDNLSIEDHCNGLLLLHSKHVVNPATRRWAALPSRPPPRSFNFERYYIVFDPKISPHYEVLAISKAPWVDLSNPKEREWPPSPLMLHIFSSRTNMWEERSFVRQGEAIRTAADMHLAWLHQQRYAAYWRGELYVHQYFVIRISLSSGKYQVIKPPERIHKSGYPKLQLGRSEKGVYFASISSRAQLQVWILNESCGQIEWVLKHQANLNHILAHRSYNREVRGPWIMRDVNCDFYHSKFPNDNEQAPLEDKFEWDSDNENVLDTKDKAEEHYNKDILILGFHPHKEVVLLSDSLKRGLAYHLNTSKLQDLGNMYPTGYDYFAGPHKYIEGSFPYTPCWAGEFPDNN